MSKLVIKNSAAPHWTQVLESRASIGLGSLLAQSRRVDIELHRNAPDSGPFTCSLTYVLGNGSKQTLSNTQPQADMAIDGVLARARRTLQRKDLLSAGAEPARASLARADYGRFR